MDEAECDALELPTAELRQAAESSFGETTESRREKLIEMRRRIEELPPHDRLDDLSAKSLIRFLRGRKFDVDRAVTSAVNMANYIKDHPTWFDSLENDDFSMLATWIQLLPERDPQGRVIMILRLSHGLRTADVAFLRSNPLKLVRWNMWFLTHLTWNLYVQVYGLIVINAFGQMTLSDVTKLKSILNINERIEVFKFIGSSCPFRLGGIYVFDEPALLRWLWNIINVFLSPKLRERFHICGQNYSAIKAVIPDISILPSCLGGSVADSDFSWEASHERFRKEIF